MYDLRSSPIALDYPLLSHLPCLTMWFRELLTASVSGGGYPKAWIVLSFIDRFWPFIEGTKSPYNGIVSAYWVRNFNTAPMAGTLVNFTVSPINCLTLDQSSLSPARLLDDFCTYLWQTHMWECGISCKASGQIRSCLLLIDIAVQTGMIKSTKTWIWSYRMSNQTGLSGSPLPQPILQLKRLSLSAVERDYIQPANYPWGTIQRPAHRGCRDSLGI